MSTPGEQTTWVCRVDAKVPEARRSGPLAGMTVGVKDNIDVAGVPTTAGCPAFAYTPDQSAPVVTRLMEAGARIVGKTNMDQFATGLVGTRSPYGAPSCVTNPDVVAGGSSSGSAVAVALGECDLALGTDTAGSGRVPAAMNGVVGLKPTRRLISTAGVVPACRSLDCVSIFARSVADARRALTVACEPDSTTQAAKSLTALSRPVVGVPEASVVEAVGGEAARVAFETALHAVAGHGAELVTVDYGPFAACGDLLYEGPWLAERDAAIGDFIRRSPADAIDPVVREVILAADGLSAVDAFRGLYRLQELVGQVESLWTEIDVLALPTVAVTPTFAQVAADPHSTNTALGVFTRFVNLMDLCAISVPHGVWPNGVPFGLQLVAPPLHDLYLCDLAEGLEHRWDPPRRLRVAVVGAHLRGQPLNSQLTERRAALVAATRTAPCYELYRLPDTSPPKPGLVRVRTGGASIDVEVWEMGASEFGTFVDAVPPPLGIGTVDLVDGTQVNGFICEPVGVVGAQDITRFGGWRQALGATRSPDLVTTE